MNGRTWLKVPSPWQEPSPARRRLLFLLLVLTLLRGLLYLAVMPPWQHYDEPTHFEYIRLLAERRQLPQPGDYELELRREIAASMRAADFWGRQSYPKIDFWSDVPPWIGIEELGHPPFYYSLVALPQLLADAQEVETQLYLARLVSVLLYVVVAGAAYGLVRELFPERPWLALAVSTLIALLPPLTDLMSAVNNDVGAVAATSLLLWAAVRLLRHGASVGRFATMLLLAGICVLTKSTAAIVALVILVTVGLCLIPRAHRRWLWLALPLLLLALAIATFTWGGRAAYWYSENSAANRVSTTSRLGVASFAISARSDAYPSSILQELGGTNSRELKGHIITLGAWLRAARAPGGTVILELHDGVRRSSQEVQVTTDWQFQSLVTSIDPGAAGIAAYVRLPDSKDAPRTVYVDGVVLVDGEMPAGQSPDFETPEASVGHWAGQPFRNLLQNGSAEAVWPGMRRWIGDVTVYQKPITMIFHSLIDLARTGWVYDQVISILFRSFWGGFGWNHVALPKTYLYPVALVSVASLIGVGIGTARLFRAEGESEPWQRNAWILLGIVWLVSWGSAVLRIHPAFATWHIRWPIARYAAVAIIPTAAWLCFGLAEILPQRWVRSLAYAGLLGMVTLDAIALITLIVPFYYG